MERSARLRDCDPREVFRSISQYESVNEERRAWNGKAYTRAANNLIENPMRTERKGQGKGSKVDKPEPMKIRETIKFLGNRRDIILEIDVPCLPRRVNRRPFSLWLSSTRSRSTVFL